MFIVPTENGQGFPAPFARSELRENVLWAMYGLYRQLWRPLRRTPAVAGILYVYAHFVQNGTCLIQGDCLHLPHRGAGSAGSLYRWVAMIHQIGVWAKLLLCRERPHRPVMPTGNPKQKKKEARTAPSWHPSSCFIGIEPGFKRGGNCSIWIIWFVRRICKTSCSLQGVRTQKRSTSASPVPSPCWPRATQCRQSARSRSARRRPPLNCKCSPWLESLRPWNPGCLRRYVVASASNAPIGMPRQLQCGRCERAASQIRRGEQTMMQRLPPAAFATSSAALYGWLLGRSIKVQWSATWYTFWI